jgi:hypothetical protein
MGGYQYFGETTASIFRQEHVCPLRGCGVALWVAASISEELLQLELIIFSETLVTTHKSLPHHFKVRSISTMKMEAIYCYMCEVSLVQ